MGLSSRRWDFQLGSPISWMGSISLGSPMSCGKFVLPSHYLPLPILDVTSPVVNSSSHLIIPSTPHLGSHVSCGKFVFPSHDLPLPILEVPSPAWKSHVMWQIRIPISLPATSHHGRHISCGKFVFPSHYLPLPILEVMSPVENASSHLVICHFPSWKSRKVMRWEDEFTTGDVTSMMGSGR